MPPEPTQKPHEKPHPYQQKPKGPIVKNALKTSAKIVKEKNHKNLTLHDWMTVFTFIDQHPDMTQGNIVKHFASKSDSALLFNQCTLSQKLKSWEELEKHITSHPNALSSKHLCHKHPDVVTRPDVERALILRMSLMLGDVFQCNVAHQNQIR
ncbi:hypothetical protein L208DRAFT_1322521 [Tricholoma matsutake]|nr:hypothetical protein L208DRAFT_1322521 [Tricholoma matsutake 945]